MSRVVVITGASAGVGRAVARAFAQPGTSIGLLARDQARLQAAKEEIERNGGQAIVLPADVSDPEQVETAAEEAESRFGPIDVWVNNAMTTVFAPVAETTADEFRRATEVTYLGVVHGTMSALRRMRARDRGTIVQVGSALAYRAIPLQAAYCGAKHAIRGFTDSLRCELLHENSSVHVTMVQLPALNTPQFGWCKTRLPNHPQPVPPIFQPEVAARAIVWAANHRRREWHVGWSAVKTIWGNKFAPAYADRFLAKNGVTGQQTDQQIDRERPANLFEPVAGDPGAHGIFDDRSSGRSYQWWLTTHRGSIAFGIGAGLLAIVALAWGLIAVG